MEETKGRKKDFFSKLGDQRIGGGEESDGGVCHKFPTGLVAIWASLPKRRKIRSSVEAGEWN